ncbi:uncharacterized protein LOC131073229 [Cryptomeria japonica]|uniref:uncharacterized protein LOC131073229 n=1 Tax=Cryptomeria japonica TaxID=3369 RepID=UPI0027DA84AF|nr:uncharacterized protein LOC131073229 [Cryptomeria japonica]
MGIPVTAIVVVLMLLAYLGFPQFPVNDHTNTTNFDLKQWFIPIFHHASKAQFAYQIASFLWKGRLLKRSIGSGRFASIILIPIAVQGYSSICHGQLWMILFGMDGFLLPAYQNHKALIIAAIFTDELASVYFLYPAIPLSGPICGTLAGLLCSYAPQLLVSFWDMIYSCEERPILMIVMEESSDIRQLVWECQSCNFKNGVFLNDCESCGRSREAFAYDNSVMVASESSLMIRTSNPEFDRAGLVWSCMSCKSENGVFLHVCESCRTPREYFARDDSVMVISQSSLTSGTHNLEFDRADLVWNCMSCTFGNGAFVHACERCGTTRLVSD